MKKKKLYCNFINEIYYCEGERKYFTRMLEKEFKDLDLGFDAKDELDGETIYIRRKGSCCIYIWNSDGNIDTTYHEALHVCFIVAEKIGLKVDEDTSEFFTYLQGDLVKQSITK